MPVATLFENLEAGLTVEEVMEEFSVTREKIGGVLRFAAQSLETPFPARCRRLQPMLILFDHGNPPRLAQITC